MTFYLGKTPEAAMKPTTIFFYASEGEEAKVLAFAERVGLRAGLPRDATTFDGITEPCTRVVIMPSVAGHHRARIEAAYWPLVEGVGGLHASDRDDPIRAPADGLTIHGPKANPAEVSQAARPDANLTTAVPLTTLPPVSEQRDPALPPAARRSARVG